MRLGVIGNAEQHPVLPVFDKCLCSGYGWRHKAVGGITYGPVKINDGIRQYGRGYHVVAAAQRRHRVPIADYVVARAYPYHTTVDAYGTQHRAYQACTAFTIAVAFGQNIVRTVGAEGVFAVFDGYVSYIASYPPSYGVNFGFDFVARDVGCQLSRKVGSRGRFIDFRVYQRVQIAVQVVPIAGHAGYGQYRDYGQGRGYVFIFGKSRNILGCQCVDLGAFV